MLRNRWLESQPSPSSIVEWYRISNKSSFVEGTTSVHSTTETLGERLSSIDFGKQSLKSRSTWNRFCLANDEDFFIDKILDWRIMRRTTRSLDEDHLNNVCSLFLLLLMIRAGGWENSDFRENLIKSRLNFWYWPADVLMPSWTSRWTFRLKLCEAWAGHEFVRLWSLNEKVNFSEMPNF